ncbi:MAG: 6-hydroxymethylpterin diphosphokinase MptE-like protein [Oceanicoccus sp.]
MKFESWRSRGKLKQLKNSQVGKKAIILCNGPSANDVDFNLLGDVYTFGLNKINLLFDKTNFRPSSIVAVNPHVIKQNRDFYNSTNIPLFLDNYALEYGVRSQASKIFLHSTGIPAFSTDCSNSIYEGYTVTYVAMQLAYHMGFKEVALLGCDHYFGDIVIPNITEKKEGPDQWHFDENYFSNGDDWHTPDLLQSECSYNMAMLAYHQDGRKLFNATAGSHLRLLPKISIEDFIR